MKVLGLSVSISYPVNDNWSFHGLAHLFLVVVLDHTWGYLGLTPGSLLRGPYAQKTIWDAVDQTLFSFSHCAKNLTTSFVLVREWWPTAGDGQG